MLELLPTRKAESRLVLRDGTLSLGYQERVAVISLEPERKNVSIDSSPWNLTLSREKLEQ